MAEKGAAKKATKQAVATQTNQKTVLTKTDQAQTDQKEPGMRKKEPGMRKKEPGMRKKEPGLRKKEPGAEDKVKSTVAGQQARHPLPSLGPWLSWK